MKISLAFLATIFSIGIVNAQSIVYPKTKKVNQRDNYFGTEIRDPYRWLEDDNSEETKQWVLAQNKVTEDYISKIPFRTKVKSRLTTLWNFPKASSPFKAGSNYFMYSNDGLQNQFVLNILRGGIHAKPEVFINPNLLSKDGTVNLSNIAASKDGEFLAYTLSKAGSDWGEINVKKTSNGKKLNDKLEWIKFSGISWKGNGFYYSRYDAPDSASILKGKNEYHKVYYHTIGDDQKNDRLVYDDNTHPNRNFNAEVTDDQDYLVISASEGSGGNNVIVKDLTKSNSPFITLIPSFNKKNRVIDNIGSKFYVLTNDNASNYKLVIIDANDLSAVSKVIIPESNIVLQDVVPGNGNFIVKYMKDATSLLKIFDYNGTFISDIPLENIGTVDQISADKKDENLFYSFISFTTPSIIYHFNLKSKLQEVYFKSTLDFNAANYEIKEKFYFSKDSTQVPIFIVHKKGLVMNGNNPTLLFGYGGFNISLTPEFKIERLVFLENGGVFAMPCLRGGGEYGENWHEAGTGLKKQNVFDDYIAAAEYLIKENYTKPSKLAISGRSNGGLLVGAVMTQRPELFKVALPTVGVMDMLRYHTFTIGWAWKRDYGSSEDETNFRNLLSYSPLHTIKDSRLKVIEYPATLVITGDHDDRVVPAHSFKFIATLQEKYRGNNPVMIRIDMNAGHASATALGSSKPVSKQINEQTDIFTFLMYNLGMKIK